MLTQQQIDEAREKYSVTPVAPSNGAPDPKASLTSLWAEADAKAAPTFGSVGKKIVEKMNTRADNVGKIINSKQSPASKVLQTVGEGFAAVTDAGATAIDESIKPEAKQKIANTLGPLLKKAAEVPAAKGIVSWWNGLKESHPETAANLEATGHIASLLSNALGLGAGAKVAKPAVEATIAATEKAVAPATKAATEMVKPVIDIAGKAKTAVLPGAKASTVEQTIAAVNPELTGKKLADAYKEVVTGDRTAKAAGVVSEQSLSPSAQAIKTGTRLHEAGVQLTGKPIKDLSTLGTALKDTETKIGDLLKGSDPSIVYNADKPTLLGALNKAKTTSPRETGAIRESKKVYDNVIDFAKELVGKTEDNVAGLRDARSAFDARARIEYPSAFKNGAIDTKTPAGQAIKAARDTMNEHLYNTAPEGSEIKRLIQLEADIFRAGESIAPKAAQGNNLTKAEQYLKAFKEHPYVTTGGAALATYGGFKFITGQ